MSKVSLKIARAHGSGKFQLGRHTVTRELKEFDLNEAEVAELKSEGPSHWLTSGEVKKAPAKKKAAAKK